MADLPEVVDLLCEGFRDRSKAYWQHGISLLAARASPELLPRFGYLLTADGTIVGVLLLIHSGAGTGPELRCNISSWYVRAAYRAYASLLVTRAVRDDRVSYMNISPSAHTLATIAAQGFTRTAGGCYAAIPALAPPRRGVRVRVVPKQSCPATLMAAESMSAADADLLADHARFGCLSLWLGTAEGGHPFIFRRRVLRLGRLPCAMLIYCRSIETLERFAGPLGRVLAGQGLPLLLASTGRPLRGIVGRHFPAKMPIYTKGGMLPRGGDLSYTEAALFGM